MKIRQTNPSGNSMIYDIPDNTSVGRQLSADIFPRDGGVAKVHLETRSGKTWIYEKVEE